MGKMHDIINGDHGIGLLLRLNADRLFAAGMIIFALMAAARLEALL